MWETWIKMAAIVIGGGFALVKFGLLDLPPLKRTFSMDGGLEWLQNEGGPSSCIADVSLTVTNISKSTIKIDRVRTAAWLLDAPQRNSQAITHFDITRNEPSQGVDAAEYTNDDPLVQIYTPGQSSHHDFTWVVQRQKDKYGVFKIELFESGGKEPKDWYYAWGLVCKEKDGQRKENEPTR
jgi:hypothetical protein